MRFVDTHCHFCDEAWESREEIDAAIVRAVAAGVDRMIQADIDSTDRQKMYDLCDAHAGVLFPMVGLYPGSVNGRWRDEIDLMLPYLEGGRAVAVGEIGLDYHNGDTFAGEQKEALRVQLELASRKDLPVNIHLRDATADFVRIIRDCRSLHLRGNIHAFSESAETFREISRCGDWYVGIGGVVTFKKASLQNTVRDIPLERILLETDAPYLAPTPLRGTRNESANIPIIASKLSELMGLPVENIAARTTKNAEILFHSLAL